MRLLVTFLRLTPRQRSMALEAAAHLALARVLVRHVPMRWWRGRLNAVVAGATDRAGARGAGRAVGGMVRRVARHLPFEAACLPQAMAAQWMLRRRHVVSRLVFGIRRVARNGKTAYHAWLTVDGQPVIGGRNAGAFTPLPVVSPLPTGLARRERTTRC